MISPPQTDEYAPFYAGYVQRVPPGSDIFALFNSQPDELRALLVKFPMPRPMPTLPPASGA